MTVKTRFAPSPTGFLHVGGARTALFSWLHARKHGGQFVLRVEDTDRERSTDEAVAAILDGMAWLDLNYDEGPYYQTQRFDRYKQIVQQLMDDGHAYHCYCSKERLEALREQQMANKEKPRYDGLCRNRSGSAPEGVAPVVRFKNPTDGEVLVNDMIRGRVVFANAELDDLIIARSDGTPVYNLCVVVDDLDMAITHVIRGDDHLNNTPRQMNILKALGAMVPEYAHLPMILGADGQKLSKRHGAVSVTQYRDEGYLPEALLNYLVRLGWSHGDQEIFSREEMIALFDAQDVNQSASAFNPSKLIWLNQHYLKTLAPAYVAEHLRPHLLARGLDLAHGPDLVALVVAQRERAKTLVEMADNSVFFFREFDEYDAKSVAKAFTAEAKPILLEVYAKCVGLAAWQAADIHAMVEAVAAAQSVGMGNVAQPLRVAAAGKGVSPPIDVTLELLGRERTLQRIERAIAWIESNVK